MGLSHEKELQHAEQVINRTIVAVKEQGGSFIIYPLSNKEFAIHLTEPIGIAYYIPLAKEYID